MLATLKRVACTSGHVVLCKELGGIKSLLVSQYLIFEVQATPIMCISVMF